MKDLLIIGGSDAGISAALRARELDPAVTVSVLLADDYPNHSICGLPFFLSGEVRDWRLLAHRTREELLDQGIRLFPRHLATAILPKEHVVLISTPESDMSFPYHRLIIATGAVSHTPGSLRGWETPGVFRLRWMGDALAIQEYIEDHKPATALIIGSGYIGMEMADALTRRGLSVTVAGHSQNLLKTVDPEFGGLVQKELERQGVMVINGARVEQIRRGHGGLEVLGPKGLHTRADMVLVAAGARPAVELAQSAGIALGASGAIKVNQHLRTEIPDIFAAGDCGETWHRLLEKFVYLPLGSTAHKQGRIAGENALGGDKAFAGTLGSQVVKIFDLAVARTGLREEEARVAGFSPLTAQVECDDHKAYYPGARKLHIRVTGDRTTGRLLGAQIIGHWRAGVAKRLDIFATAIFQGMKVADLDQLDLSYTPPLSSPWDPVQMGAGAWCQALRIEGKHQV